MNNTEKSLSNYSARSLGIHYSKDEFDELINKQIIIKDVSILQAQREVDFTLYDLTARKSFSNCTLFKEEKEDLEKEMLEDIEEQNDLDFVQENADDYYDLYNDIDHVTNDCSHVDEYQKSVDFLFNACRGNSQYEFSRAWQRLNEEKGEYVGVHIFADLFDEEENRMIVKAIRVLMQSEYLSKISDRSFGNSVNIDQYKSIEKLD